ncbi:MAG: O-antigen ligase family protein [Gaiellaceae bacterium]|jgi:hypothetical protein
MPSEKVGGLAEWQRRLWPGGLSDLAISIPVGIMLVLFIVWAADQGGFPSTVWYPGALLALWLLVICVFDARYSLRLREWRTASLVLFGLFTIWCFLSITWATVKGDAWDGANQTLLYLTVYAIFSRWPTNVRIAGMFVSVYVVAVAAIGFITVENALRGGHPASIFLGSRMAAPIGYQNGEAALFLIPLWPALFLASRKEVAPLVRGLLAASAGLLLQLVVLAQSRGSMYAFPIVFVLFVLLVSGRGRAIATALAVIAVSAINLPRLLDVYRAGQRSDHELGHALAQARNGMLLPLLILLVGVTLVAFLDRRLVLSGTLLRRLDRGTVGAFGLGVVLTGVIAVSVIGHPLRHIENGWHSFKTGAAGNSSSSHFTSFAGTNRYDFWRVSVDAFRAHPVGGVGTNNFAVEYLRARRSNEEPSDPHSLEMRVLLQGGVIGALLFVGFLASAFVATRRKKLDPLARGLAGSLIVAFVYWIVHGSVDWFWQIPALTTVALACLGLATALAAAHDSAEKAPRRGSRRVFLIAPVVVLALVASASYAGPWISARYVDAASRGWPGNSQRAYRQLDRARSLDPLSETPDLIAGTIAGRLHDYPHMRAAYTRALTRNPSSWYAHFELGLALYLSRDRRAALAQLERAAELNPREPLIVETYGRVKARKLVDLTAINRIFLTRALRFALGTR